jgi:hypothetical protein
LTPRRESLRRRKRKKSQLLTIQWPMLSLKKKRSKLPKLLPKEKLPRVKLLKRQLLREKLPKGKLPKGKLPRVKLPKEKLVEGKLPKEKLPMGKLPEEKLPKGKLPQSHRQLKNKILNFYISKILPDTTVVDLINRLLV